MGKSSHRPWTSPGIRCASCSRALGMRVGGGVCRGAEGPCTHSGARPRVLFGCMRCALRGRLCCYHQQRRPGTRNPRGRTAQSLLRGEARPDNDARPVPSGRVGRRGAPLRGHCSSYNMLLLFALAYLRLVEAGYESSRRTVGVSKLGQARPRKQVHARYWRRARGHLWLGHLYVLDTSGLDTSALDTSALDTSPLDTSGLDTYALDTSMA